MSLVTVLAKSKNFGKSESWKRQTLKSTQNSKQIETNFSILQKVAIFFKFSNINASNCWKLHCNLFFELKKFVQLMTQFHTSCLEKLHSLEMNHFLWHFQSHPVDKSTFGGVQQREEYFHQEREILQLTNSSFCSKKRDKKLIST